MYRSNKGRKLKQMAASGALAVGLIAGGVGIASASTASSNLTSSAAHAAPHAGHPGEPDGRGPGVPGGIVTAVTSNSITVSGPDKAAHTFSLTSATTMEKGHATATASDLAVGERVMIRPLSAGSNVAADVVIDTPHVAGSVVAVNGSSIVVSDEQGFYRTITVNSSTTYATASASASLAEVTVGTFIVAEGSVDANHTTLDASSVAIGVPSAPAGAPGLGDGAPGMGA